VKDHFFWVEKSNPYSEGLPYRRECRRGLGGSDVVGTPAPKMISFRQGKNELRDTGEDSSLERMWLNRAEVARNSIQEVLGDIHTVKRNATQRLRFREDNA